ncbi:hypothetical protein GCM10020331_072360 [Ectobacillus funiculus]
MGAMEEVHAKSYSHIFFTTLATEEEIDGIFFKWVDEHPLLEKKRKHDYVLLPPPVKARGNE